MTRRRSLTIPGAALAALTAGSIGAAAVAAAEPTVVVQPGDTLSELSVRHDIEVGRLVRLNGITDPNRIYAGQRLRLTAGRAPDKAADRSAAPGGRTHTVRSGEHLTGIARRYGVTPTQIVAGNRLADPNRIYAGQRLVIPGSGPRPSGSATRPAPGASGGGSAGVRSHTVSAGEHLTGIGRRYGVTPSQIVAANRLADPNRIYAGQRLAIPGSGSSGAGPAGAMPASMASLVGERAAVGKLIAREARRFGVPVSLAKAVAWQESGWQQHVVSSAGAAGVMQLLPSTADWVGQAMLRASVDERRLDQNVRAGVRLLAHYLDRYDGSVDLTLAAYYQGQRSVDTYGVYAVSRPYIASIRVLQGLFR